eukprot:m.277842 g.277842  ORF g.277842 m.277842 type:complete len:89 (+) comp15732_c4_seq7:1455-1721(+)
MDSSPENIPAQSQTNSRLQNEPRPVFQEHNESQAEDLVYAPSLSLFFCSLFARVDGFSCLCSNKLFFVPDLLSPSPPLFGHMPLLCFI